MKHPHFLILLLLLAGAPRAQVENVVSPPAETPAESDKATTGPIDFRDLVERSGWLEIGDDVIIEERIALDEDDRREIRARTLYMLGTRLYQEGDDEAALQAYRNALEIDPENPNIKLALAEVELRLDDTEEALEIVREILENRPEWMEALLVQAAAQSSLGRQADALGTLERASEYHPRNIQVLEALAEAYRMQGNIDKLIEVYTTIAGIDPNNLRALYFLSWAWSFKKDADQALYYIDEALQRFPSNEQLHERKLQILANAERHRAYRDALRDAIVETRSSDEFVTLLMRHAQNEKERYAQWRAEDRAEVRLAREDAASTGTAGFEVPDEIPHEQIPGDAVLLELMDFAKAYPHNSKVRRLLAERLTQAEELERALEQYGLLLEDQPDNSDAHFARGKLLVRLDRYDEALDAFKAAQRHAPFDPAQILEIGRLYSRKAEYEEAADYFREGLRLEPKNLELAIELARALRDSGKLEDSLEVLNDALTLVGPHPLLYYELASTFRRLDRTDLAEQNYERAIEIDPSHWRAWIGFYNMQLANEKDEQAEATLERILERFTFSSKDDPRDIEFTAKLVNAGVIHGRLDLALKVLEALVDNPDNSYEIAAGLFRALAPQFVEAGKKAEANALRQRLLERVSEGERDRWNAELLWALDEMPQARDAYQRSLERNPRSILVYNRLLSLLREMGEVDAARDVYDRGMEQVGDVAARLLDLEYALVLSENDRKTEAKDFLLSRIEAQNLPSIDASHYYRALGDIYAALENYNRAYRAYETAIELNPNEVIALNNYGYLLAQRGESLDRAEDLVKRALNLQPNAGFILDSLGWVYYKKNDLEQAIKFLEAAVARDSDNPELNEHLGDAYQRVGKHLDALKHWKRALSMEPNKAEIERKIEEALNKVSPAEAAALPDGK